MCGIGAILQQVQIDGASTKVEQNQSDDGVQYTLNTEDLISVLSPRGPDYCGVAQIVFDPNGSVSIISDPNANTEAKPSLTLVGCVLSMRGEGGWIYVIFLTVSSYCPTYDQQTRKCIVMEWRNI